LSEKSYEFAVAETTGVGIGPIGLRPATPADAPFAYSVKKLALGAYIAQTWGWNEDEQVGCHRREYKPQLIRIITLGGTDIGTVAVTSDGGRVLLCMLYLLPEYQRHGIGTRIVRSVQAQAQRDSLPVRLAVLKVNPAQELYRRFGFMPVEETATHVKMEWNPGNSVT
jgi:ribosomal protein S18 acetylase RimI-like enzyme